ncbi:ribosome biogenesis GTPase Der [Tomitella gaofuii]|uniref:ribosome biogenesis GTPase Der n=1 Tax=Tomitella gaofuii TaxID=2760083 RepID=UPI0015FA7006|nr:ribosome biogenesis GTPase Der [Tomitella gaofuii]
MSDDAGRGADAGGTTETGDIYAQGIGRPGSVDGGAAVDGIWSDESDWTALDAELAEEAEADAVPLPVLAIVGRPNVGKSTLVNRLIGRREAVVEDVPGVTRDRVAYTAEWAGRRFMVQDTGGWEPDAVGLQKAVARQAETAMAEADAILLVVDATVGATATDEAFARILRRSTTPVLLVANKVDSSRVEADAAALWSLGLGEPHTVSAIHGRRTGDLLDLILESLPETPRDTAAPVGGPRRVALVGKPNVGKSSLLNKLSGGEIAVVHDVAGTTVDPVDTLVELGGSVWRFVDTAGLRRKVRQASGTEFYASLRTRSAIDAAELAILLIDASQPITEQDLRVLSMVVDAGRALVVVYNKWDLVDEDRRYELEREIDREMHRVPWAQRVNVSALTGRAVRKLVPAMETALESWDTRVPTGRLNNWLKEVVAATPPPMRGGRLPRIMFATQAGTRPPTFVLFTTGFLEAGYRRFLERRLREEFGFAGSPVRISVRVREKRDRRKK